MTELNYLVALGQDTVYFSDTNENTSWIQAFKFGKIPHPVYGDMDFSEANLSKLVTSVNTQERGIELATDYEHREADIASGWIREAKLVKDNPNPIRNGVYLLVEWTKKAALHIKNQEYKYFSPTFDLNTFTAIGGALTNRPFLKGMEPINLSEFDIQKESDTNIMDRDKLLALAGKLGLEYSDDITDEALGELITAYEVPETSDDDTTDDDSDTTDDDDSDAGEQQELDLEGAALSENVVARLKAQEEQIANLTLANRMSETQVRLAEFEGKLSPKVLVTAKKLLVRLSDTDSKELFELLKMLPEDENLKVLLSEEQGTSTGNERETDFDSVVEAEIAKLTEGKDGLTYMEAFDKLADEKPELFTDFRASLLGGSQ